MSITAKPLPDLLSMPNEVLANICTYAADGDDSKSRWLDGKSWLKAVRLTCKQLYASATTVFAKKFFKKLHVIAARGSLETLLKICEHPLIGPQVCEITFLGCRLDHNLLSPLRRSLESSLRRRDLRVIRQARHRLQLFMDVLEEEVELEEHVGVFELLVNALRAIRNYGHSIKLIVSTDTDLSCSTRYVGHQEVLEHVSRDGRTNIWSVANRESIRSSLDILLTAAAESGCQVDHLELSDIEAWYEKASSQREKKNRLSSRAEKVLLNVTEFTLFSNSTQPPRLSLTTRNNFLWPLLPVCTFVCTTFVTTETHPIDKAHCYCFTSFQTHQAHVRSADSSLSLRITA